MPGIEGHASELTGDDAMDDLSHRPPWKRPMQYNEPPEPETPGPREVDDDPPSPKEVFGEYPEDDEFDPTEDEDEESPNYAIDSAPDPDGD